MQTRLQSLKEALFNTAAGAVGNWLITAGCIGTIDHKGWATAATISGCTVYSTSRTYFIRRCVETGSYPRGPLGWAMRRFLSEKIEAARKQIQAAPVVGSWAGEKAASKS